MADPEVERLVEGYVSSSAASTAGKDHPMIDEPRLIRALDVILFQLTRLGRACVPVMQPGLRQTQIASAERALPFQLPGELRALYRWRNGTFTKEGDTIAALWFFPGFNFPPLKEAIQIYGERKDGPQWKKGWFPFFADFAGDFYIVACSPKGGHSARVIGFVHGEPEQAVEYLSVTTMLETLADCYEQGAFFVNDDGLLDIDDDLHRRIARQHNPGVAEWQD